MLVRVKIPVSAKMLAEWCRNIDGACPLGPIARCPFQTDVSEGQIEECKEVTPEMWEALALPEEEEHDAL